MLSKKKKRKNKVFGCLRIVLTIVLLTLNFLSDKKMQLLSICGCSGNQSLKIHIIIILKGFEP